MSLDDPQTIEELKTVIGRLKTDLTVLHVEYTTKRNEMQTFLKRYTMRLTRLLQRAGTATQKPKNTGTRHFHPDGTSKTVAEQEEWDRQQEEEDAYKDFEGIF